MNAMKLRGQDHNFTFFFYLNFFFTYTGTETSRLGCQVEITKEMDGWLLEARGDRVDVRD